MGSRINSTSAGSGLSSTGWTTRATTGTIQFVRSRVVTGWSPPITSTAAGGRAISSHASRTAASTGPSPTSIRPPGKTTSPGWVRMTSGRLVRMILVSPCRSAYSGTSTADTAASWSDTGGSAESLVHTSSTTTRIRGAVAPIS